MSRSVHRPVAKVSGPGAPQLGELAVEKSRHYPPQLNDFGPAPRLGNERHGRSPPGDAGQRLRGQLRLRPGPAGAVPAGPPERDATWRAYFDKALGLPPEPESTPVTVIVNEAPRTTRPRPLAPASRLSSARTRPRRPRARARRRWPGCRSCPATCSSRSAAARCGSSRTWRRASRSRPRPPRARSRCGRSRRTAASSTKHREASGQGKVSFTTSWPGDPPRLDTFPRLNDAYSEVDGSPTGSSATR